MSSADKVVIALAFVAGIIGGAIAPPFAVAFWAFAFYLAVRAEKGKEDVTSE